MNDNKGSKFNALSRVKEESAKVRANDSTTFHFGHKDNIRESMLGMDTVFNGKDFVEPSSKGVGSGNNKTK